MLVSCFTSKYKNTLRAFCLTMAMTGTAIAYSGLAAVAQELTPEQISALHTRISDFNRAMHSSDYNTIASVTPPKMIAFIAGQAGMDQKTLRDGMISQIKAAMEKVTLESYSMDLAAAEYKSLSDNSIFALIPTETIMDIAEMGRIQQRSDTLALLDEGQWYLVRIADTAQASILRQVYPQFADVEFSRGSMNMLKQAE